MTTSSAATGPASDLLQAGLQLQSNGRLDEAIAAFERGLSMADPAGEGAQATTDLHFHLGNVWFRKDALDRAEQHYKAALRINAGLTSCWCNFGNVLTRRGRPQDAVQIYLHTLSLDPRHWAARVNLVEALIAARQFIIARAVLQELVDERPELAKLHHQLGKVHFELEEFDQAEACFEAAIARDPNDAESANWIGGLRQRAGDETAAQQAYARAAVVQPLIRRPAKVQPAPFRVLALYAPFGGNTPAEYLFRDATYDVNTLALIAGRDDDIAALAREADLVVNLVSDPDQSAAMLPVAAQLIDRLGKPALNDPRAVACTTREAVAERLAGIAGARVAKVLRCAAGGERTAAALLQGFPPAFPLLARPAGTHGGDDFEKLETPAELEAFAERFAATDIYLIEYLDYRSADGLHRKYRFIFVSEAVMPYHLAIDASWKLHHEKTDMAHHAWMQDEEQAFLADPGNVFGPQHYQTLNAIRAAIGLDYFGIDCGLDAAGDLVVFEVNASMLVHDHNERFRYKAPAVECIKEAFNALLHARAGMAAPPLQPAAGAAPIGVEP